MQQRVRPTSSTKKPKPAPNLSWFEKAEGAKSTTIIPNLYAEARSLYEKEKFSSCNVYKGAARSIERFCASRKQKQLYLSQVDQKFLEKYEQWMLQYGRLPKEHAKNHPGYPATLTTVSMYLTALRHIYRQNMAHGGISYQYYPFGQGKFIIAKESTTRQPRSKEEIDLILDYLPKNNAEFFARDLWLFSYYGNGMNLGDILNLKWEDVDLNAKTFSFYRLKSSTTTRGNRRPIQGILFERTIDIIDRWSSPSKTGYVFRIYEENDSELEKDCKKRVVVNRTNRMMKRIAENLGITGDLRSNVARHSFVNAMLRKEVPVEAISELVGHSKINTTQHYISRFPSQQKAEYLSRLVD